MAIKYLKAEMETLKRMLNLGVLTVEEYRRNAARIMVELELMGA